MTSLKHVERCTILVDMAHGLCCRIFNAKMNLASTRWRPSCLTNPEFSKVKSKVEKSFPENPGDMSKVPGVDLFRQTSVLIINELTFFNDIMADVSEFKKAALILLKNIPKDILHFKLDRNRSVIILYFDLMLAYMKVLSIVASIDERKSIIALYMYAHSCSNTTDPNFSEIAQLLVSLENIQRLFIDDIASNADFIGINMLQFFEILKVYDHCENLRKSSVLNPTNDGDHMSQPARMTLTQRADCDLSMYTELSNADAYVQYCIFGFLACPMLLFSESPLYLDLFRLVVSDNLVVEIFRDLTLNIHNEFESIYSNFPGKRDAVIIPKGLKVKNILKDIAKVAASSIGAIHQARRSYVHAEICNLNHLISAVPGLIAPKFPMILAAASMAKGEIMHYFRHLGQEPRRDVKKHFNADQYKSRNISVLIHDLHSLTRLVEDNCGIIQVYYAEYLARCDYNHVFSLITQYISNVSDDRNPNVKRLCHSLPDLLNSIDIENTNNCDLRGYRLNWERISTYISMSNSLFKASGSSALFKRMNESYDRSHFVDNLEICLKKYFVLHELWWFQSYVLDAYHEALNHTLNPISVFAIIRGVEMNLHPDCPEEISRLNESSSKYCDMLIAKLGKHIESTVRALWDICHSLELKTKPADAAKRFEKAQHLKQLKNRSNNAPSTQLSNNDALEQYPGSESEEWNRKSIGKLMMIKRNIISIFSDLKSFGKFFIFDREYDIESAIRKHLYMHFESRLNEIMVNGSNDIERPSIVLSQIIVGLRAMHVAFDFIDADCGNLLRSTLFQSFCDTLIPPPGAVLLPANRPSHQIIGQITEWFVKLVNFIATSEGLLWVPYTNEFTYAGKSGNNNSTAYSMIKKSEMMSLCSYIGPQGVRAINSSLLSLVCEKTSVLRDYVNSNKAILLQIQAHGKPALCASLVNSQVFIETSIVVGIVLAVRESLRLGLRDSVGLYAPFVEASLHSVSVAIDPWADLLSNSPTLNLASYAGCTGLDLELNEVLLSKFSQPEDKNLFALLPYAYGASFMSPYWSRSTSFIPSLEAFTGNEHCIALAISKYFACFCNYNSNSEVSLTSSLNKKSIADMSEIYLELSSNVLLSMKLKDNEFSSYPLRGFACILELFTKLCVEVDRSVLEEYFPYSLLHSCHMDISLGKLKQNDNITSGINSMINAV